MRLFAVLELRRQGETDETREVRRREGDRLEGFAVTLVGEDRVVLERDGTSIELALGERHRFVVEGTEHVLRLVAIRAIDARALPGATPLERDLLAAIVAAPEDDAPRLVYADWLLSQPAAVDRERGELVQLQCALAAGPDREQRPAIRERERELLALHPSPSLGHTLRFVWSRGFLERCRGQLEDFARNATQAFHVAPLLASLDLAVSGWALNQSLLQRLASISAIAQIRELSIVPVNGPRHGLGDDVLAIVVPAMSGLRRLRLGPLGITAPGIEALLATRACAQLTMLNLSGSTIGVDLARALADSRQLAPAVLRLAHCSIGAAQLELLGAAPWFAELEELDLGDNPLRDRGAIALSKVPFKRLRSLALGSCEIRSGGATLLASRHLAKLRYLRLHKNPLGDAAVAALARSRARSIEDLDLHACGITEAGVRALAASANLRALRRWQIGGNAIGDAGAQAIAASEYLRDLETLEATDCQIGDAGAQALRASSIRQITIGS